MTTSRALILFAAATAMLAAAERADAQKICVEEAAGVCLKYEDAPQRAAPARPQPQSPAAREEQALRLSRGELREVQAGLRAGGYYNGGLDGVIGSGSRRAISRWQSDNGETVTGYLTFDQVKRLRETPAEPAAPERQRTRPLAPAPAPEPEPVIAAPEPQAPPVPVKPERGRSYRVLSDTAAPESWLDPMLMTVKVRRRDDTSAVLEFNLSNANQYAFSHDCVVELEKDFVCSFYGPNRNKNTWAMSGRLPELTVANGWIGFNKTYTLW